MPTYDYRCNNCGHEFEVLQMMSDSHLTKCPECGQETLKRLLGTGAGILFKGSGFYETDYRSDSYNKAKSKDTKKAEKKTSDTKTDKAKSKS